jgi:hypothetical protein
MLALIAASCTADVSTSEAEEAAQDSEDAQAVSRSGGRGGLSDACEELLTEEEEGGGGCHALAGKGIGADIEKAAGHERLGAQFTGFTGTKVQIPTVA